MAKEIREAFGEALVKYGKDNKDIVVLDADVSSSTKSCLFAKAYPDRFFNVGIAEANMVAMAAGLSAEGKIPFANTFAVFITSIGLIAARTCGSYSKMNIKLCGAYAGLSDAYDGPTHHALEDMAIMRALPGFQVYVASDEYVTDWMVKHAIEDPHPMYLRLSRDAMPTLYNENTVFEAGKGYVVREGSDVTIIACGMMVSQSLKAAEALSAEGINARVVDMYSIKPIDRALILESAACTGCVVTVEEHNIIGGLGGAVAEALTSGNARVPQVFVGMRDTHAECGQYSKLLSKYCIDATAILRAAQDAVALKTV
ncbi:MAG: transketolase C-terminal domain-containing protein [Bacillota bacterium]